MAFGAPRQSTHRATLIRSSRELNRFPRQFEVWPPALRRQSEEGGLQSGRLQVFVAFRWEARANLLGRPVQNACPLALTNHRAPRPANRKSKDPHRRTTMRTCRDCGETKPLDGFMPIEVPPMFTGVAALAETGALSSATTPISRFGGPKSPKRGETNCDAQVERPDSQPASCGPSACPGTAPKTQHGSSWDRST